MTRVLKIGTVGWYHDDVRNRFKRFGSAKVMRSLYKRLNGDAGRDDDTQSMPDVRSSVYNGMEEDDHVEEVQRYKVMRKNKRLLSVHPLDFDPEEYFPYSRRPSVQTPSGPHEEEKLSDKNRSSDEEAGKKTSSAGPGLALDPLKDLKGLSSSSDEGPTEAQKVYMAAGQPHALEAKLKWLERSATARHGGATDSELSELEDVVTRTAARVQSAESKVSDIESKIAALTSKKKVSGSQRKKSTQDFSKGSNGAQWKSNLF
ncbi:melanophilin-like [Pseudoliparis swirei]|uniref:melanophilin-like n=1 Tax=Pseudoliparis swirei TaxID=2059687 RepID=UPI0024BE173F|nr:melanophilin-like [Pseudoliparis swirei]